MAARPPIRLALLGCGLAARLHARTLRRFRGEAVWAFASRRPGVAQEYARRYGGAAAYDSYEAALADPQVDAVLVLTPPALHLEWTERALAAGKHVIVEKPAFPRAADFDRAREAAARAGRLVLVAENYAYKPAVARLREIIESGALGDVLFLHVNALKSQRTGDWRDDPALAGGGALLEGGVHWIHFMGALGLTIESARGARPGARVGAEKSLLVTLRYREGAVGTLAYSWEVHSPLRGLRLSRIYGTRGAIAFESNGLAIAVHGARRALHLPGLRDPAGYRTMFRDLLDALREGREARVTLERARRDVELIEQVYRSLEDA
jgi:predicted dehydrogenase